MPVLFLALLLSLDGQDLFLRRCSGCHAADLNKEGPKLRGVFGRPSASVNGFDFSQALKKASIKWDDQTLDRWLADPEAMVPGTDMAFRLSDPAARKAIIDYLRNFR
jgi:cytochrome c